MTQPTFFAARTLPVSRLGCFRLFRMLSIAYGKKICVDDAASVMIRLQTAHARWSTSGAVTLRRRGVDDLASS